jgi:hypothetical protein
LGISVDTFIGKRSSLANSTIDNLPDFMELISHVSHLNKSFFKWNRYCRA